MPLLHRAVKHIPRLLGHAQLHVTSAVVNEVEVWQCPDGEAARTEGEELGHLVDGQVVEAVHGGEVEGTFNINRTLGE